MKSMTNSKVRQKGKAELVKIFQSLKLKDGLLDKSSDFAYFYNKARDGHKGNYIIYETIESGPITRADDKIYGREYLGQIDIFSLYSFETKKLQDLITELEERLDEQCFEVEMKEELFENESKLYHLALLVSKAYYF